MKSWLSVPTIARCCMPNQFQGKISQWWRNILLSLLSRAILVLSRKTCWSVATAIDSRNRSDKDWGFIERDTKPWLFFQPARTSHWPRTMRPHSPSPSPTRPWLGRSPTMSRARPPERRTRVFFPHIFLNGKMPCTFFLIFKLWWYRNGAGIESEIVL